MEEIVAVRTFRSRLPVRRVRHMDRRGQEVQNNFLTDHISSCFIHSFSFILRVDYKVAFAKSDPKARREFEIL